MPTKKKWSITVRTNRDTSVGLSSNSGNPYIDSLNVVGKGSISRERLQSKELHQARVRGNLKAQLQKIQNDADGERSSTALEVERPAKTLKPNNSSFRELKRSNSFINAEKKVEAQRR